MGCPNSVVQKRRSSEGTTTIDITGVLCPFEVPAYDADLICGDDRLQPRIWDLHVLTDRLDGGEVQIHS